MSVLTAETRRIGTIREDERRRREIVFGGEIQKSIRSSIECERSYQDMARKLHEWADVVRVLEKNRKAAEIAIRKFNRNAEVLLGENIDFILESTAADCRVKDDDVTCVTTFAPWNALLNRIAEADTCTALTITKGAYKIAIEALGRMEPKLVKLRNRLSMSAGSAETELEKAKVSIENLVFAVDIIRGRKDMLVDLNLKLRRSLDKFVARTRCDPNDTRELTDEERAALAGLI